MELTCCHGNHNDIITNLEVLPNNRVTKMLIVYPHDQISFFITFYDFIYSTAMKNLDCVAGIIGEEEEE